MSVIGVFGMGVMGRSLALNMARNGYAVSVYDVDPAYTNRIHEFAGEEIAQVSIYDDLAAFCDSLEKPRRVLIMVTAGAPVDNVLGLLSAHLEPGDITIDGGNSFFTDTRRREAEQAALGLHFFGMGVSGGERGAREGAALMPGGNRDAYEYLKDIFVSISAKTPGGIPCCGYVGPDGAGHFVKMVHNGIEYGDMQVICECYQLMRQYAGMTPAEIGDVFETWNQGRLRSYLIDITAQILRRTDEETGLPMVDVILDSAGQKGTGNWTSKEALNLGIPLTAITESVFARFLSSEKKQRVVASQIFPGATGDKPTNQTAFLGQLEQALYASKICCYAQGFSLLAAASREYNWDLSLSSIALNWRAGCIIQADFLDDIAAAYEAAAPENLIVAPFFAEALRQAETDWREVGSLALRHGVAAPVLCSTIAYFDGCRTANSCASLIQAQRDFFGAHTYQRTDREGTFHTKWEG